MKKSPRKKGPTITRVAASEVSLREALECCAAELRELVKNIGWDKPDALLKADAALAACPAPDGETVEAARRLLEIDDTGLVKEDDVLLVARAYLALAASGDGWRTMERRQP